MEMSIKETKTNEKEIEISNETFIIINILKI
jgi:DNA-directed RNA polymerase subunit L